MPKTIIKTKKGQIIGGTFSSRENVDKAVAAFQDLDFSPSDIQVVVRLNENQGKESNQKLLKESGFSQHHASYYDELVRKGRILVAVYGVIDPAPVIDIFDKYNAEYNPNGSRNLREDVIGMTAGAAVGAVALGSVGAVFAGPVGAAVGLAAGAVVGGGSGAAGGKVLEHRK